MVPPSPWAVSRRTDAGATFASKSKGVEASVGADIEPVADRQQVLKMAQSRHLFVRTASRKEGFAGVSAIAVQPIVAFGTEHPDDRVRAAIGRGGDRGAFAAHGGAPARDDCGRRAGTDLQNGQRVIPARIRAVCPLAVERHIDTLAGGVGGGRGLDRAGGYDLGKKAAAKAAETIAIEEIGAGILSERQHQRRSTAGRRDIQRERIGAAEVGVARIERAPIAGSEEVLQPVIMMKLGGKAKDRLAVAPGRRADRIAGSDEQRAAIAGDAARRPDTAAPPARAPADHVAGIPKGNTDDPAAVVAAIAGVPPEGHKDAAAEDGERAALVLKARVEA